MKDSNEVSQINDFDRKIIVTRKSGFLDGGEGLMKETILLVDVDPERADMICHLLTTHEIPAKRCRNIDETIEAINSESQPAVIVVHCALVRIFTRPCGRR